MSAVLESPVWPAPVAPGEVSGTPAGVGGVPGGVPLAADGTPEPGWSPAEAVPLPATEEEWLVKLADPWWRLTHLYRIADEDGRELSFQPNEEQADLYRGIWYWNLILKARQLGFCVVDTTRVLTADLRWVAIRDLEVGQEIVAVDEHPPGGRGKARRMRTASVLAKKTMQAQTWRVRFDDGREVVCTDRHPWLSRKSGDMAEWRSLSGEGNQVVGRLNVGTQVRWVCKPWDEASVEDGWMGGMLDGEGSMAKANSSAGVNVSQRPGPVWDRLVAYARDRGYNACVEGDAAERPSKHGRVPVPQLAFGRMDELFRLMGQTRPTRFIGRRWWEGRELPGKRNGGEVGWATIVSIEPAGEQTVVDLQTSTGTYIAEGFVSHNTTLLTIMALDQCLFVDNFTAAIVFHNLTDAEKAFRNKVKFAYERLPEALREKLRVRKETTTEIVFENGSSLGVGVSARSGTIQWLHVSEFGKLCAKYPEKAREVVTGSFGAVPKDGLIFIESTAEGQCYDGATEILTDGGWKFFRDLTGGEQILTMDPLTRVAYYQPEWTRVEKQYRGAMVRMDARGVDLRVTPNHRMWVARQKGPMQFLTAAEMVGPVTDYYFERTFLWDAPGLSTFTLPEYRHVQGAGWRTRPAVDVPIDVWLSFLGVWLADGHVTWRDGQKQVVLTQVKHVDVFRRAAHQLADAIGARMLETEHGNGRRFIICSAQLADYLRQYTQPKRISRELLMGLSSGQCRQLMEAIYLGDGCAERRERETAEVDYGRIYAGLDKPLQDDMQELALKAGWASNVYGPENCRTTTFTESARSCLKHDNPPSVEDSCDEPVYCVTLPKDHLLMVRRGGVALWCGNSGYFYDYCMEALKARQEGRKPARGQFKLHFYPWWSKASYVNDDAGIFVSADMEKYFEKLRVERGIVLRPEQKRWYVAKAATLGGDMKREYPAFPEEAFEQAIVGAIYAKQMEFLRTNHRITSVPWDPAIGVHTFWDLGANDTTAIWFMQRVGMENRFIDYEEESGEGFAYFVKKLRERPYLYELHHLPHDARSKRQAEKGPESPEMILKRLQVFNLKIIPRIGDIATGIDLTRSKLPTAWFDREKCAKGIKALDSYQYEWDENRGAFSTNPLHNWASNGADALRQWAQGFMEGSAGSKGFRRHRVSWRA
jgi:hypothetical protein